MCEGMEGSMDALNCGAVDGTERLSWADREYGMVWPARQRNGFA